VIQCLVPSAVTSLGSPAELDRLGLEGVSSAWTSEFQERGATGHPAAPSLLWPLSFVGPVFRGPYFPFSLRVGPALGGWARLFGNVGVRRLPRRI